MTRIATLLLAQLIFVFSASVAAASDLWLHVRVQDHGGRPENVSVNVPLSLVESLLPMIEVDELRDGRLRLDDLEVEGFDLRELMSALRDAPDADYVRVQGVDEEVRVSKENGYVLVNVDEQHGDRVRVRIPLDVVEAMLQGPDDELDILAGLRALSAHVGEDLVVVEGRHESVRIWIDADPEGR
jgi:hypothetical protein